MQQTTLTYRTLIAKAARYDEKHDAEHADGIHTICDEYPITRILKDIRLVRGLSN